MTTVESTKPQQDEVFHSALFEHLASYSLVGYAYKTAQTYYSRVKTSNRYLEYGLGTAEYITAAATKTAEPLLSRVDEFGLKQLVKVEERLSVPLQKLTQLPVDLLEKTLAFGEDSLDYWLPVEESEPKSEHKKAHEATLSHLGSRAYTLADTLQTRARDKVAKSPYVTTPVELVRTKVKQAKELKDRAVQLPSAVSQYVTQRKNAVAVAFSSYYSHVNHTFNTLTEHLFDFLYYLRHQYDTLKATSPQDFGIFLANTLHRFSEYLYEHVYPTRYVNSLRSLYQRLQEFVARNVARFSKKEKKTPTENGHHEEGEAEKRSD